MAFASALRTTAALAHPPSLDQVARDLDPAWILDALTATGTATLRRRRLPAEQVLWLVLGMALCRDRAIVEVAARLDLALPGPRGPTAAPSAVSQARTRLGPEPLAWLFAHSAAHWASLSADQLRWRGLALYGLDGTTLRVPDSAANRAHFGGPASGRGASGYPQVRLVALLVLRSHLLRAVAFGPAATDERVYAQTLWPQVPDHSLTVVDRNFLGAPHLLALAQSGHERHWLVRAKARLRLHRLQRLGRGDALVEFPVSPQARRADPTLPPRWRLRAIHTQRPGHAPQVLLTSLLDPARYPAAELVALYHERWEQELGYDELKTELLEREEALRSQRPATIAQELWGLLLVYNLVRLAMARAAQAAHVAPTRISFIAALHLIRDEWLWCAGAAPGAIPRHLGRLRQTLTLFLLPPRRPGRRYPRAVKLKMSNYPRNRCSRVLK
jgi:Insertion element 4 transposase N-terminal/Transposase DDE domain